MKKRSSSSSTAATQRAAAASSRKKAVPAKSLTAAETISAECHEVLRLIETARHCTFQAVNVAMIELYWNIGEPISRKISAVEWGDGVVDELAAFLARSQPGLKGFSRQNLFRMKQFYESYHGNEIVSPRVRQLSWPHHLSILGQAKMPEEREFYIRMAIREKGAKRKLERQFRTALFARTVLSPPKVSPRVIQTHPDASSVFRDSSVLEFLGLPDDHSELDLHRGLNQTQLSDRTLLQSKLHEFYQQLTPPNPVPASPQRALRQPHFKT